MPSNPHVEKQPVSIEGSMEPAKLVHQTVVVDQRGDEAGFGSDQGLDEVPGLEWGSGTEQPSEEEVAGLVVGDITGGEEEGEALVGFGETVGVAERVKDGGNAVLLGGLE